MTKENKLDLLKLKGVINMTSFTGNDFNTIYINPKKITCIGTYGSLKNKTIIYFKTKEDFVIINDNIENVVKLINNEDISKSDNNEDISKSNNTRLSGKRRVDIIQFACNNALQSFISEYTKIKVDKWDKELFNLRKSFNNDEKVLFNQTFDSEYRSLKYYYHKPIDDAIFDYNNKIITDMSDIVKYTDKKYESSNDDRAAYILTFYVLFTGGHFE